MGRFISENTQSSVSGGSESNVRPVGFLGIFGSGYWRTFGIPGTYSFTVPPDISSIRVRVVGGGGSGSRGGSGGGGGGYAHGVFSVVPGSTHTVVVGLGGIAEAEAYTPGGSSSFGSLISATGGGATPNGSSAPGGIGVGGDFQAKGGSSGVAVVDNATGGGAAGSQLGDGGNSGSGANTGGGGVGGGDSLSVAYSGGGSPFGSGLLHMGAPDCTLKIATGGGESGVANAINATYRFPFDGFTGGGGSGNPSTAGAVGGPGAGGGAGSTGDNTYSSSGGVGGGGGTSYGSVTVATYMSAGGIGGGGGGTTHYVPGRGGNGLVVVEW